MLRSYAPELTGWFDDFGHSGFPDAFGGIGRISTTVNAFTPAVPDLANCGPLDIIIPGLCDALSAEDLISQLPGIKYLRRCPGANERGVSEEQLTQGGRVNCDPTQVPVGP